MFEVLWKGFLGYKVLERKLMNISSCIYHFRWTDVKGGSILIAIREETRVNGKGKNKLLLNKNKYDLNVLDDVCTTFAVFVFLKPFGTVIVTSSLVH